jgi:hypothetical protein
MADPVGVSFFEMLALFTPPPHPSQSDTQYVSLRIMGKKLKKTFTWVFSL